MNVSVTNTQREAPVNTAQIAQLARRTIRRLRLHARGTLAITFVSARRIRALNKQFLRHDRVTDVLSFGYDGEPTVGDIVIAPRQARAYATRHGIPYEEEIARYVVHGLLHWAGHEDRTSSEQRKMRVMEDRLLVHCGLWIVDCGLKDRQSEIRNPKSAIGS
ncbi:MAG: rRNA maturation RNase YbeY [Candidatus Omnitrophica bacterium]|nr:rRNA maturation RNase YbeY [Candidatus Omnitrophota bacterium]MBI3021292.1 rRNA maturation RNase YbeY [Candidatus Omnitrophota bacterium]